MVHGMASVCISVYFLLNSTLLASVGNGSNRVAIFIRRLGCLNVFKI